jgi:hypothetical protein
MFSGCYSVKLVVDLLVWWLHVFNLKLLFIEAMPGVALDMIKANIKQDIGLNEEKGT